MTMCVEPYTGTDPTPKVIIDTATLLISLDNQGNAIIQVSILTSAPDTHSLAGSCLNIDPSTGCFIFPLGNVEFRGFLDSDNMKLVEGSKYYEHNIVARGIIC